MNKFSIFLFALITVSIFSSCQKDNTTPDNTSDVNDEEIVEIVTTALMFDSEGLTSDAAEAAKTAESYDSAEANTEICGTPFDSTIVYEINRPNVTGTYTSTIGWMLECNSFNIPIALIWNSSTTGDYETMFLESEDNSTSDFTVTELLTGPNFIINGTFNRDGIQGFKEGDMPIFTSSTTFNLNDLAISKIDQQIVGGEGTFLITGIGPLGNLLSIEGGIVFNDDGSAIITINGNTYEIDLY